MLISTGCPPPDGMWSTMMVSDRWPPMSKPVESFLISLSVRPCRLSDPVMSQLAPSPWAGLPE